jgi:hypothetical protein
MMNVFLFCSYKINNRSIHRLGLKKIVTTFFFSISVLIDESKDIERKCPEEKRRAKPTQLIQLRKTFRKKTSNKSF